MASETGNRPRLNRLGLIFLSLWLAFLVGSTLYGSWTEPQAQGQISLYQTNLTLEALEWQPLIEQQDTLKSQLFGETPVKDALTQYQKVRTSVLEMHPQLLEPTDGESPRPTKDLQVRETLDQLDLKIGILMAQTSSPTDASQFWDEVEAAPYTSARHRQNVQVAEALNSLWRSHPSSEAESVLANQLSGWFQTQSLEKLYRETSETKKLETLHSIIQSRAQSAVTRLAIAVGLPLVGSVTGVILLILWGFKIFRQDHDRDGAPEPDFVGSEGTITPLGVEVPWAFDMFWLTMLLWFFAFFGVSLIIPLSLQLIFGQALTASARGQALLALSNYSGLIVAGLALILYMTRPYVANFFQWLPLSFERAWISWGLGGYLAALPLVLIISVANQKLLGEQGGGNPLLEIILQTHDIGTWFVLLFMVSVLAPLFEETVFRGFALTSLSRYLPMWGAIAVSAVLFAVAHLNIADFLPLVTLGCILGTIYAQSRNLLASILLHSLWNGVQLVELLYLSSN